MRGLVVERTGCWGVFNYTPHSKKFIKPNLYRKEGEMYMNKICRKCLCGDSYIYVSCNSCKVREKYAKGLDEEVMKSITIETE